jgi:hypothetical protein
MIGIVILADKLYDVDDSSKFVSNKGQNVNIRC